MHAEIGIDCKHKAMRYKKMLVCMVQGSNRGEDEGHDGGVEIELAAPRLRMLVQQNVEEPHQLQHALVPGACMPLKSDPKQLSHHVQSYFDRTRKKQK